MAEKQELIGELMRTIFITIVTLLMAILLQIITPYISVIIAKPIMAVTMRKVMLCENWV